MPDSFYIVLGFLSFLPFVFAALKGRVGASVFGFVAFVILIRIPIINLIAVVFLGLAIYRAFSLAQPHSLWAKWFYDEETLRRAEDRYLSSESEVEEGVVGAGEDYESTGDLVEETRLNEPDEETDT